MEQIAPQIPGSYNGASVVAGSGTVVAKFVSKQAAFTIDVNGLMPSTLHYVFFENTKVAANNLKPLNKALGDPLYTDTNGKLTFVFYFTSPQATVDSSSKYLETIQRIGGDKKLVIANANSSTTVLPDMYEQTYTSWASKMIFFKTSKISELPVSTSYNVSYQYKIEYQDVQQGGGG
jgi:hypothetical protein